MAFPSGRVRACGDARNRAILVGDGLDRASVPNVGAPRGEETDVPAVLGDRVRGTAVGLELDEEPRQGVVDGHGPR